MPAQIPNDRRPRALAAFLALTALFLAGATARLSMAKTAPKPPKAAAPADVASDDLQEAVRRIHYEFFSELDPAVFDGNHEVIHA